MFTVVSETMTHNYDNKRGRDQKIMIVEDYYQYEIKNKLDQIHKCTICNKVWSHPGNCNSCCNICIDCAYKEIIDDWRKSVRHSTHVEEMGLSE